MALPSELREVFGQSIGQVLSGNIVLFQEENFIPFRNFHGERILLHLANLAETFLVVEDQSPEDYVVAVLRDLRSLNLRGLEATGVQVCIGCSKLHERFLTIIINTMLREKKVSTLTVSLTMALSTSERFMRRKMLVATTAVLFPWSLTSMLY